MHGLDQIDVRRTQVRGPRGACPEVVTSTGTGVVLPGSAARRAASIRTSSAAALYQVPRVARARQLNPRVGAELVERHIEGRLFGLLGEPRLNVLALNPDYLWGPEQDRAQMRGDRLNQRWIVRRVPDSGRPEGITRTLIVAPAHSRL